MPLRDRTRLIYSLAGALVSRKWSLADLKLSFKQFSVDQPLRIPKFIDRIFARFPAAPPFCDLVAFLRADAGLTRAMFRASFSPARRRAMDTPPPLLQQIIIPKISTPAALAKWFRVSIERLLWRADITGRNRKHPPGPLRTYRYRWLPKPNAPPRLLEIPKRALKEMQRKILAEIVNPIPPHPAAHGFRPGRSILTNAAQHCSQSIVIRFDLTDFFRSITSARIFRIFRTIGYPTSIARLLTGLCTTKLPADVWDARPHARLGADFQARQRLITRHLPQGAPTSPALANLAATRLDRRLATLAGNIGANYTRYADDLIFSGGPSLARSRKRLATLVAVIADDEGFALNHRKTRMMRAGVRQQVTGLVVNAKPNIRRRDFDQLKAILTNCVRHGPATQNRENCADFRARLLGKIAHITSIHPTRGQKLHNIFEQIIWQTPCQFSPIPET